MTKRPAAVRNPAHVTAACCVIQALQEPLPAALCCPACWLLPKKCRMLWACHEIQLKIEAGPSIDGTRQVEAAVAGRHAAAQRRAAAVAGGAAQVACAANLCAYGAKAQLFVLRGLCCERQRCLQDRQCQLGGLRTAEKYSGVVGADAGRRVSACRMRSVQGISQNCDQKTDQHGSCCEVKVRGTAGVEAGWLSLHNSTASSA
jgi:hypothetical protein